LRFARCFEIEADEVVEDGKDLVERFLADPSPSRWGGLVLTTALVYRTETAQIALTEWPEGLDNITLQLFLTGRCALEGVTVLTKDTFVEMAAGRHFFDADPMMYFRFRIAEIPEAFIKLAEIGYSPALCQQKILNQRKELRLRTVARLFAKQPLATLGVLRRHLAASRKLTSGREGRSVRRHVRPSAEGGSREEERAAP
jgi:abequosyltransferase